MEGFSVEGALVGVTVGVVVGLKVGLAEGLDVGFAVGTEVGCPEGLQVYKCYYNQRSRKENIRILRYSGGKFSWLSGRNKSWDISWCRSWKSTW